ncbi:hypothetical protein, partial [Desulfosporosinus acididurans]|uniref:hypothetical protein n=1 Tax=Desulfosporosinus acididurans TaxID=476652 RepID=UPI0006497F49
MKILKKCNIVFSISLITIMIITLCNYNQALAASISERDYIRVEDKVNNGLEGTLGITVSPSKNGNEMSSGASNLTEAYDKNDTTSANIFDGGYIIYKLSDLGLTSLTKGSQVKYTIGSNEAKTQRLKLEYLDSKFSPISSSSSNYLTIKPGAKNEYTAGISSDTTVRYLKINGIKGTAVYIYEIAKATTIPSASNVEMSSGASNLKEAYDKNDTTSANIFDGGYIIYKLSDLGLTIG